MGPCHLQSTPREYSRAAYVRYFYKCLPDADSKIFGVVKCARDCEAVQSSLSNMGSWVPCNNIQFNTSNC